jgi:ankyrin repeat protein
MYAQTTDFFELVKTGTAQQIQAAMDQGAGDIVEARDEDGFTGLMHAAGFNENPEVITTLLKAGADLMARDTKFGMTPLMLAAAGNQNPEVITTLLKAGADINARDKAGQTPLMVAAYKNENPDVIMTLLKAGADAKVKDGTRKTAFDYAGDNEKLKDTDAYWTLNDAQY